MPTKNCLTCGDEFSVQQCRMDDAKFCSRDCYHKGQRQGKTSHPDRYVEYIELECTGCGKKIEKLPSRANKSDRQFCNQECYINWNQAHVKKRTGKRARMREKSSAECEICGWDRFIEMAHIIPSRDGGTYHKYNILFLCPNHHRLLDHRGLNPDEFLEVEYKIRKSICDGFGWKDPTEDADDPTGE